MPHRIHSSVTGASARATASMSLSPRMPETRERAAGRRLVGEAAPPAPSRPARCARRRGSIRPRRARPGTGPGAQRPSARRATASSRDQQRGSHALSSGECDAAHWRAAPRPRSAGSGKLRHSRARGADASPGRPRRRRRVDSRARSTTAGAPTRAACVCDEAHRRIGQHGWAAGAEDAGLLATDLLHRYRRASRDGRGRSRRRSRRPHRRCSRHPAARPARPRAPRHRYPRARKTSNAASALYSKKVSEMSPRAASIASNAASSSASDASTPSMRMRSL